MTEPVWLTRSVVEIVHSMALQEHGGAPGIRDAGLLEAALDRPRNLWGYETPDLFDLAAAYAGGLLRNHPFIDGNKRIAFMALYIFLERNGVAVEVPEVEAAAMVLDLAAGDVSERDVASWLRGSGS